MCCHGWKNCASWICKCEDKCCIRYYDMHGEPFLHPAGRISAELSKFIVGAEKEGDTYLLNSQEQVTALQRTAGQRCTYVAWSPCMTLYV